MINKLSDYHIHTHFSTDSEEQAETIITSAITNGLKELCFTDHIDYDYPSEPGITEPEFVFNINDYFKQYAPLVDKYRNDIKIKIGVELGLMESVLDRNIETASSHPFDFIIGSTHLLDGKDPYYPEYWEGRSPDSVLEHFFLTSLANVKSFNNYDIYGHLDYIVRYIPDKTYVYSCKKFMDIIDEILKTIIYNGHGIEVNTSALAKGMAQPNPCYDILKRYRELGGEILTFGSDAHMADKVGYDFERVRQMALECGFKYYSTFTLRRAEFNKL